MAISRVATVSAGSTTANNVTTAAIDTTGATLLVVCVGHLGAVTVSDSKGNTWTALTQGSRGRIYYVQNPTVGSGHTFSVTSVGSAPAIAAAAYSNTRFTGVLDKDSKGDVTGSATAQPGSVTPDTGAELLILLGASETNISSVDSGFTIRENVGYVAGQHFSVALADLIQGAPAAINPTVTFAGATDGCATIATFRPNVASQMLQVL